MRLRLLKKEKKWEKKIKKAMMKDELEASKELMNVPAVRARPPDIGDDDDER